MRTEQLKEVAEKASSHYNGQGGFPNSGRINAYRCTFQGAVHITVTIDREPGVTPFTIECPYCKMLGIRAKDSLYQHSEAQSYCYRVPQDIKPTHEWYRPDTLDGLADWSIDHVLKGGLLLRQIDTESSKAK